MTPTATATPKAQFTFSTTLASSQNVVTATLTALDGNRQAAQLVRRVSDARGFDLWPADDGSSALVGDDEGLTLWRVGGQSLRFATRGRPSSAWLGRLTPDGPVVAVALVGNQIKVFGASSDMIREGVLWRVPRPSNDVQTSQEEENAQSLDKTGRK
jgi:hypothetical protein